MKEKWRVAKNLIFFALSNILNNNMPEYFFVIQFLNFNLLDLDTLSILCPVSQTFLNLIIFLS